MGLPGYRPPYGGGEEEDVRGRIDDAADEYVLDVRAYVLSGRPGDSDQRAGPGLLKQGIGARSLKRASAGAVRGVTRRRLSPKEETAIGNGVPESCLRSL